MQQPNKADETPRDPDGEFPFAVPETLFAYLMHATRLREAALRDALVPLGLGPSRHRILVVLARLGPTAMSEISLQTGIDRTTLTRIADRLVDGGLVERTDAPGDRRQVRLVLTDKGRAAYRGSIKAASELNRAIASALPERAQRELVRALASLVGAMTPDEELRRQLLDVRPPSPRRATRPA
jgi:DNA-binding MarR family transcriptional regulator